MTRAALSPALTALIEQTTAPIRQCSRIGGGDFAEAFRLELADGRRLFAKTHANAPPHFFDTEARGLEWLRDAIRRAELDAPALDVAEVVLSSDDPAVLALDWIDTRPGRGPNEAAFGRALAALHRQGFDCFGRPDLRTTGSLALPNTPSDDWASFYANCRLLPLIAHATDRQALPQKLLVAIGAIAERLGAGTLDVPVPEYPVLLHGDLWAGNRIVDQQGQSWLIDPAAHGGHREFDLAMMRLFGGFDEDAHASYQECWPLEPDWQRRVALHQLAPLMVHAIKFGGPYAAATADAVAAWR